MIGILDMGATVVKKATGLVPSPNQVAGFFWSQSRVLRKESAGFRGQILSGKDTNRRTDIEQVRRMASRSGWRVVRGLFWDGAQTALRPFCGRANGSVMHVGIRSPRWSLVR
jgi:hypothetical protein